MVWVISNYIHRKFDCPLRGVLQNSVALFQTPGEFRLCIPILPSATTVTDNNIIHVHIRSPSSIDICIIIFYATNRYIYIDRLRDFRYPLIIYRIRVHCTYSFIKNVWRGELTGMGAPEGGT